MLELKYSEILARNRELKAAWSGTAGTYHIAVLSNIVMSQLDEVLECSLRERGIKAEVTIGEYDNIVQDSERLKDSDAVVLFWEIANIVEGFHATVDLISDSERLAIVERIENDLALVMKNLSRVPLVLFNRFSSLMFAGHELRRGHLSEMCNRLNACLERRASPSTVLVDTDRVVARVGLDAAADMRQFQTAKALYSIGFLKSYVDHIEPSFLAATGLGRKVLVLDCDNTLWGGVVGEDGHDRVQMSNDTPLGRVFREAQLLLLALSRRGVLLALCSKNNSDDVDRILSEHADMVLGANDLVARKVNWCDKVTNIRQLSQELNLGLDSFVFLDDSEYEIGLVRRALPQVRCYKVPDRLSEYPAMIRRLGREFFSLAMTAEDAVKTELYRQERQRRDAQAEFESIGDYLRSLGLKVQVVWGGALPVGRAAQLSQKTNQFNLTTRRYTDADIRRILEDSSRQVATFAVSDRFGDYGVVGLLVLATEHDPDGTIARVETLLMSCRVLGRNVERALLDYLMARLARLGVRRLRAEYMRTARNEIAAHFYDTLGLKQLRGDADTKEYEVEVSDYRPAAIDYIEVSDAG